MSSFAAEESALEIDEEDSTMLCTYPLSGDRLVHQAIYVCNTCHGQNTGQCCCSGCAFSCHDGHDVQFMAFGRGYCDCGAAGCALAHGSVEAARAMLPDGVSIALDEKGRIEGTMQTGLAIAPVQEAFITAPWDMIAQQCAQVVSRSKDTFWLSASDMTAPKCALEALAACIFQHHTRGCAYDFDRSGAEWWVQVKPPAAESLSAIDLHYDKDENIAEAFSVGVFPQISTVTYVSSSSSFQPTMVFNTTAGDAVGTAISDCFISFPRVGKHVAFDGRFLHGAPEDPLVKAMKPSTSSAVETDSSAHRITFLVNIWIHHHPSGVLPLPPSIADEMNALFSPMTAESLYHMVQAEQTISCIPIARADIRDSAGSGEWVTLPFVSDNSTWGRDDDEAGIVLRTFIPNAAKMIKSSTLLSSTDSFMIRYQHEKCAGRLEYETFEEADLEFCTDVSGSIRT